MKSPPITYLLDKGIIRRVFEAEVRVIHGKPLLQSQVLAVTAYNTLLELGLSGFITSETRTFAFRVNELIANSICKSLITLSPGKYFKRWVRRLLGYGFNKEDSEIISYACFGVDHLNKSLGTEVILTMDKGLRKNYVHRFNEINKRFVRMTSHLKFPYRDLNLPKIISVAEFLYFLE